MKPRNIFSHIYQPTQTFLPKQHSNRNQLYTLANYQSCIILKSENPSSDLSPYLLKTVVFTIYIRLQSLKPTSIFFLGLTRKMDLKMLARKMAKQQEENTHR